MFSVTAKRSLLVVLCSATLTLAACSKKEEAPAAADMMAATALEGALDIVAWPGYIESGQTDKAYDWVSAFEGETGCKVTVKTAGTSDEMVSLMASGGPQPRPVPRLDADNRVIGYWTAVDAVREGFYPNLAEIVKQSAAPAELERSGALDEVQEHKSALNEEYLQLVAASAGLGYVRAESVQEVASAVTGAGHARHEKADRDMRLVFGLASALLVTMGWVRKGRAEG